MLDEFVDTAAARAALEGLAKLCEVVFVARDDYLNIAVFGIANPAFESQFARLPMDEPTEAHPLHPAPNLEVKHHSFVESGEWISSAPAASAHESVISGERRGGDTAESLIYGELLPDLCTGALIRSLVRLFGFKLLQPSIKVHRLDQVVESPVYGVETGHQFTMPSFSDLFCCLNSRRK